MVRAKLDKRPHEVAEMFDLVAARYDLLNDVLSAGQDRRWRHAVAAAIDVRPGERVLDVAAGTGASSRVLAEAGADCVACDFSLGMLQAGAARLGQGRPGQERPGQERHRQRNDAGAGRLGQGSQGGRGRPGRGSQGGAGRFDQGSQGGWGRPGRGSQGGAGRSGLGSQAGGGRLGFVAGDALDLPLRDGVFDAVTISFGLRNVADPAAALAEMRRVTRPGGRLLVCEFSHLSSRRLDALYQRSLAVVLPAVARRLSPNPDAYVYLAESIGAWPGKQDLAGLIRDAGWSAARWRTLSFGVVALHHATNPPAGGGPPEI